jgi:hypothetical protein
VEDLEDEVAHVLTNWKANSKLSKILSKEKECKLIHKEVKRNCNNRELTL